MVRGVFGRSGACGWVVGVGMGGRRVWGGGARAGAVEVAEDAGRLGREAFSKAFGN